MIAQDLLQKYNVSVFGANDVADPSEDELLSEVEAFMNVVTENFQGHLRPSIEKTPREVDQVVIRQLFHGRKFQYFAPDRAQSFGSVG